MAKYMVQGSYTVDGVKGLLKEGAASRVEVVRKMVEGLGGKLETIYWGFGDNDVYVIADLPDNASAAAVSLTVVAGGAVRLKTVVLLTAEEVDAAAKKSVAYRPPGA